MRFRRHGRNVIGEIVLPGVPPLFIKLCLSRQEALGHIAGWKQLESIYPVPRQLLTVDFGKTFLLVYELVAPEEGVKALLGSHVRHWEQSGDPGNCIDALDAILHVYKAAVGDTRQAASNSAVHQKLFLVRLRDPDRLPKYYGDVVSIISIFGPGLEFINSEPKVPQGISLSGDLRPYFSQHFADDIVVPAGVTQGDPTLANLCWTKKLGPTFLDFELGGLNSLIAEVSIFAVDLLVFTLPGLDIALASTVSELTEQGSDFSPEYKEVTNCELTSMRRVLWIRFYEGVRSTFFADSSDDSIAKSLEPYILFRLISVFNLSRLSTPLRIVFWRLYAAVWSGQWRPQDLPHMVSKALEATK